jgi:hypothetical protein
LESVSRRAPHAHHRQKTQAAMDSTKKVNAGLVLQASGSCNIKLAERLSDGHQAGREASIGRVVTGNVDEFVRFLRIAG